MWRRIPRALKQSAIALLAVLLVASGTGVSLLNPQTAPGEGEPDEAPPTPQPPQDPHAHNPGVGDMDLPAKPLARAQEDGVPSIMGDFEGWLAWSHSVPLQTLAQHAQQKAPESGQMLIPKPDAFTDYPMLDEKSQREAWQSWWIATVIAAMRVPSVGLDPAGYDPNPSPQSLEPADEQGTAQETGGNATSDLGDPHSLDRLWRLQTHGPPRIVLPAGDQEQMYLVTDRGVLFVPEAGAQPAWMLNLEGMGGHAEVIERESGNYDLVVGMHSLQTDQTTASIWVVDGEEERVVFQGLRGERSLLHWTLTDVDGDGEEDILGIDRSGNVTAIQLDGEEIYRTPLPKPDLPEASIPPQPTPDPIPDLPAFPVLALTRTGAQIFGDATGDGTMDIFTTSFWGPFILHTTAWVSLVDGASGEEVWSQTLDTRADKILRVATATVTGDLTGDGRADVAVWEYGFSALVLTPIAIAVILVDGPTNTYFAGENGALLAKDKGSPALQVVQAATGEQLVAELSFHVPLAFTDLDGNGENVIVAIEGDINEDGEFSSFFPAIQIRERTPAPGAPTTVTQRHELELDVNWLPANMVQFSVRKVDEKDVFIFLAPDWATPQGEPGVLFTLDSDGFEQVSLPEPIGHFDINPQTGQRFAWTLADDRFTPVDAALRAAGNGTRMIMGANPLLAQSLDGGVPDLLIPRTLGYFWVSGRTGAILEAVDRPFGTTVAAAAEHEGRALVLEHKEDEYSLFDVREQEVVGSVSASSLPDQAGFAALVDVDGDDMLDAAFRSYGFSGLPFGGGEDEQQDEWVVYSFEKGETIWSQQGSYIEVYFDRFLPNEDGNQMLVIEPQEERMSLHSLNSDGPVWSESIGFTSNIQTEAGLIAMTTWHDDEEKLRVLDGSDGSLTFSKTLDEDQFAWMRVVKNTDGRRLLVHSYAQGSQQNPEDLAQYVILTDLKDGKESGRFDVTKPRIVEENPDEYGWTFTFIEYTTPGVTVGDWNDDGYTDLALREAGWPTVRSLKDGSMIALAPVKGTFSHAIDLNQDGDDEVGLMNAGSLRMYAYDPALEQLEREDPLARVDAVDPDTGDNETKNGFFDDEKEQSPGPGALLVLVAAALAAGIALRRRKDAF